MSGTLMRTFHKSVSANPDQSASDLKILIATQGPRHQAIKPKKRRAKAGKRGSADDAQQHLERLLPPCMSCLARGGNLGQRPRSKRSPQLGRSSFQKRKRNPTVGAMLLRCRKPEAKPPFTCVNMIP